MSRVIQHRRFGGPEVLELVEAPDQLPEAGHVRIAVRAAGLNPVDAKTFEGAFPIRPAEAIQRLRHPAWWHTARFPRTVGRDFAGVIDAVGPGVADLRVGQAVLGTLRSAPGDATRVGSLTTHLIAPVEDVVAKPDELGFATAGALGVAAQTACGALRALNLQDGDVLAISGAAGAVGSLATQLAVQRGTTVLGIAGPRSADQLRVWGAIPVSYDGDVAANLRAAAAMSRPVTTFLDCYGGPYVRLALGLGVPAKQIGTLVPSPAVVLRGVRFTGSRHAMPGDLEAVAELVGDGRIQPQSVKVLPFDIEAVRAAYAQILAGTARGKLVVDVFGDEAGKDEGGHAAS